MISAEPLQAATNQIPLKTIDVQIPILQFDIEPARNDFADNIQPDHRITELHLVNVSWAVRKNCLGANADDELRSGEFGEQRIVPVKGGRTVHSQPLRGFEIMNNIPT